MAKKKLTADIDEVCLISDVELGRGQVKDNALKAMVTSKLYRAKVEKAKKGKGSYQRNMKHKGKEPYSKAA
ncbi:alternative ribosome-rescue factor A [Vibrio bivalvicida]|uniref:Alternative ribosome-rescue factor A n=1 Tax=Vibrio bivalvicida TaxID=1276888 RepID=A0ABV4MD39_9VIBR